MVKLVRRKYYNMLPTKSSANNLDKRLFYTGIVILKECFKKVDFEKSQHFPKFSRECE